MRILPHCHSERSRNRASLGDGERGTPIRVADEVADIPRDSRPMPLDLIG
jgi:hypothetical protein